MTSEQFHDALTLLPADLIAQADEIRRRKPRTLPWKPYAATAACLTLLLCGTLLFALRPNPATTELAAAPKFVMKDSGTAEEAPQAEAAAGSPDTSRSAAAEEDGSAFACIETPYNPHSTACYAHGPSPAALVSREELEAYLSKWSRLYLLDPLEDACDGYDGEWFSSHDLLLIPVDDVTGPCAVTEVATADGGCEITLSVSSSETEEQTNYHILLPLEKNAVTDLQNIRVIYISDTID